jgi:hypothetical protein
VAVTAWASQTSGSIPSCSATQRATSPCGSSAAPRWSSRSNHSSQPRPVLRRIASSDVTSAGASVVSGYCVTSSIARAAV